jgi:hypothetical protein
MHAVRAALVTAALVALPSVAWGQTTTTSTLPPTTTTTVPEVTRIEDLVCSEPVNNVATCVDPQGRVVTRVIDLRQVTTTTSPQQPPQVEPHGDVAVPDAAPAPPTAGRQLALTG